jgi:protein TonB
MLSGRTVLARALSVLAALLLHGAAFLSLLALGRPVAPPEVPVAMTVQMLPPASPIAAVPPPDAAPEPAITAASSMPEDALPPTPLIAEANVPVPLEAAVEAAPQAVATPVPPDLADAAMHPAEASVPPSPVVAVRPAPEQSKRRSLSPARVAAPKGDPGQRARDEASSVLKRDAQPPVPTLSPSVAATLPAAPPAPAGGPLATSWQGQLSAWLQAHKVYPESARQRGEQGTATVRFTVARDGRVVSVDLTRGSGSPRLDSAAIGLLHDARVPPFPPDMTQAEITVTVQIRYVFDP